MQELRELAIIFKQNGFKLFAVGGCVRDKLRGVRNADVDLCSKATLADVKHMLAGTKFLIDNERLGCYCDIWCKQLQWDYSSFRNDVYKNDGSHFPIAAVPVKKMRQDARRRDFTVNAIYENILTGKVHFFFEGHKHLRRGILMTCKKAEISFKEDALRILRLARFAAQLGFVPAEHVMRAARQNICLIKNLSKNTIAHEVAKMPDGYRQTAVWRQLGLPDNLGS